MKSITCVVIVFLEDKEDINFVVDGWDNNFFLGGEGGGGEVGGDFIFLSNDKKIL